MTNWDELAEKYGEAHVKWKAEFDKTPVSGKLPTTLHDLALKCHEAQETLLKAAREAYAQKLTEPGYIPPTRRAADVETRR